jgi:hypothetical protein
MARIEEVRGRISSCAGLWSVDDYVGSGSGMMLTVRQRQQAVRVWAMRLWPVVVVPSSGGCGAPSVFVCVAVATSIARLSPGGRRRTRELAYDAAWDVGEIDAHVHAREVCRAGEVWSCALSLAGQSRWQCGSVFQYTIAVPGRATAEQKRRRVVRWMR